MKTLVIALLSLFVLTPFAIAANQDSIAVGDIVLTLGMSTSALEATLPSDARITWMRDTLPKPVEATKTPNGTTYKSHAPSGATITYAEEHGEQGFIERAGERIAVVVFENGKLTRAFRLVSAPENAALSATDLMTSVAPILNGWSNVTVQATHAAGVDEVRFRSGAKQLIVLAVGGRTQIVEHLGRDDIASVTTSY